MARTALGDSVNAGSANTGSDRAAVALRHAVPAGAAQAGNFRKSAGLAGEMALQTLFGHQSNQSAPQALVHLVGYRDPSLVSAPPSPAQPR